MNVIRHASLQALKALKAGSRAITKEDILQGIQRELAKEGKV